MEKTIERMEKTIERMDKLMDEWPYVQCRFWHHDVMPECDKFRTREEWVEDCKREGYFVGYETIKGVGYDRHHWIKLEESMKIYRNKITKTDHVNELVNKFTSIKEGMDSDTACLCSLICIDFMLKYVDQPFYLWFREVENELKTRVKI